MVQGELGELLVAADRALVERTALEKQVKQHLAQEQVKRKMLFFICFLTSGSGLPITNTHGPCSGPTSL